MNTSGIKKRFTEHARFGATVWTHNDKLVWITQFDATRRTIDSNGRPEHWNVYYAIVPRKKGATHWAHDNKRLGEFLTLHDALIAGHMFESL